MPKKVIDPLKVGDKKGNLTVLEIKPHKRGSTAKCLCTCGRIAWFQMSRITGYRSNFASCNIDGHRFVKVTHGYSMRGALRTTEHCTWVEMRQRCENPNHHAYKDYGGRGISVCNTWQVFENFISDMGNRPSPKHTLERINNNGNYEPGNCKWATRKEQARNRRTSRIITCDGISMTMADWADKLGVTQQFLHNRLYKGWSDERTIKEPKHFVGK